MKCSQVIYSNEATHRFTWPGRSEAFICDRHVDQLQNVASAMGLTLQVIPLDEPLPGLTLEQAIVLTGFTGVVMCPFQDLQADVEKRMGRPVFTHQFGSQEIAEQIKQLYKPDFERMTEHLFRKSV